MNTAATAIRPLRCTAFEEFMLDQDSPAYPCVICLRLELAGNLDAERLKLALHHVVQQHPLLRSKLQWRYGKLWWHVSETSANDLAVHRQAAPAWPVQRHFDLSQEFGWQAELYPASTSPADAQSWTLFLQVHHAIADGLGCWQIVEDLLYAYAQASFRPATTEIELSGRNRFGLDFASLLRLLPKQLVGLAGVRQFLTRQPLPLSPRVTPESATHGLAAIHHRCTAAQSQQLKQVAKQQQATLNDLLACLVFEACDQYRRMQMSYRDNDWLRMMVPMNLRQPRSTTSSVCNVVSCVFLDRTGQQISDRLALLQSIHDEMTLIKDNELAFVFIFSLWIKKLMRWRTRRKALMAKPPSRCQTSLVFSNMGKLLELTSLPRDKAGRVVVQDITVRSCDVLAPIAPLMRVAITTYQYAGHLTLALRYDPSVFALADAQRLLGLIVERIASLTPEPVRA